jgi:hypothetical protein
MAATILGLLLLMLGFTTTSSFLLYRNQQPAAGMMRSFDLIQAAYGQFSSEYDEQKLRELGELAPYLGEGEESPYFFSEEDRQEARRLWEQQHQESIKEVETALNVTREVVNETIAEDLSNPQVQAAQAQDPQFKTFVDIWHSCMNSLLMNISSSNSDAWTILPSQCTTPFNDATNRWCGLDQYDPNKCALSSQMSVEFGYLLQQLMYFEARLAELRCMTQYGSQC